MEASNMCESEHQKFQKKYNEALETRKEKKNPKSKKKRKENPKKKPLVTHSLHPYEYFCHLLISSSTLSDTPSLKPPLEYVAHLFRKKKERLAFIPNSTEKKVRKTSKRHFASKSQKIEIESTNFHASNQAPKAEKIEQTHLTIYPFNINLKAISKSSETLFSLQIFIFPSSGSTNAAS